AREGGSHRRKLGVGRHRSRGLHAVMERNVSVVLRAHRDQLHLRALQTGICESRATWGLFAATEAAG
ncbi:MAG: hypothetical protein ACXW0F_00765, partial [Gaiellaceae bacterium]